MLKELRKYNEGDYSVTEYTRDGVSVATTIREILQDESQSQPEIVEPQPTIEQQILAELQYNTALTEMKMLGGI